MVAPGIGLQHVGLWRRRKAELETGQLFFVLLVGVPVMALAMLCSL